VEPRNDVFVITYVPSSNPVYLFTQICYVVFHELL